MVNNKFGIIYKVTSPSGKIYIGKTIKSLTRRKNNHIDSAINERSKIYNTKFSKAIRKYNDLLKWEILKSSIPEDRLDLEEILAIYIYDSYYDGYNSTPGGEGHKGKFSKEHIKNLSISHLGYKPSDETRKKMSENSSKYWLGKKRFIPNSVANLKKIAKEKNHHNKGRKFTEEHKQKLSLAKKGKTYEERYGIEQAKLLKIKLSNAIKDHWKTRHEQ